MNLETKRNALLNSVASSGLTNLFETLKLAKGYITNNGVINQPDQRKEIYTVDFIPSGEYILMVEPSGSSSWVEDVYYTLNETYKTRNSRENTKYLRFTIADDEKGRICFVTNGQAEVGLFNADQIPTYLLDYDEV